MFTSLKQKIKEETGNDVCAATVHPAHRRSSSILSNLSNNNNNHSGSATDLSLNGSVSSSLHSNGNYLNNNHSSVNNNNHIPNRFTAITSQIDQLNGIICQKNDEIAELIEKLSDAETKFTKLSTDYGELVAIKERFEQSNCHLEDAFKVAQEQKELIHNEQDKIQNLQSQEITKLKNLLHFREQEAIDRLATLKQKDNQIDLLQSEAARLRTFEENFENVQDELEKLRHSTQMEKNNLTASLASIEEQNRHLNSKLQIYEEGRINFSVNQSNDEKVQTLLRERRMLEQRLEEAHLHLSDIKSRWSAQNMALETQVDRLSRQVAAETTEKRKALLAHDELAEKCKQLSFQLEKTQSDIDERDQKIKLMSEEIDDLSLTYQEYKSSNEEEVTILRTKVTKLTQEIDELKSSSEVSLERLNAQSDEIDKITKLFNERIETLQNSLQNVQNELEKERKEKNSVLLKNVEMSQTEERLKQQIRNESHEITELNQTIQNLTDQHNELQSRINNCHQQIEGIDELKNEISEKNKTIKMLNQRLTDMKKTLQHELKSGSTEKIITPVTINSSSSSTSSNSSSSSGSSSNCTITANNTNTNSINNSNRTKTNGYHVTDNNGQINGNATDKNTNQNNNNTNFAMDDVNFKYLKHVILKFLTSREVEARHLVRAIGTLLNLNSEEEQLLHETLNFKVGWFGSRMVDAARSRHHKLLPIQSPSSTSSSSLRS